MILDELIELVQGVKQAHATRDAAQREATRQTTLKRNLEVQVDELQRRLKVESELSRARLKACITQHQRIQDLEEQLAALRALQPAARRRDDVE